MPLTQATQTGVMALFDDVAILRSVTYEIDSVGNQVPAYEDREVYVVPRSIYSNEFYQAAHAGLKPTLTLVLSNFAEYEGEEIVEFRGTEYTILRSYHRPDRDTLELTIEERVSNE